MDATIGVMGDERIAWRHVRARFTEGEVDSAAHADDPDATKLSARFVSSAMAVYGSAGGVWMGGTATLTMDQLIFSASPLRRTARNGVRGAAIALGDVRTVFVTPSFPANVVTVIAAGVAVRLRCRRAQQFADQIAAAARAAPA